jgi:hypothetical protein
VYVGGQEGAPSVFSRLQQQKEKKKKISELP